MNNKPRLINIVKPVVSNFVGCIVRRGNKVKAQHIFLLAIRILRKHLKVRILKYNKLRKVNFKASNSIVSKSVSNNVPIFKKKIRPPFFALESSPYLILVKAVIKAAPNISLQSKRVGGVIYRLPRLIRNKSRSYSIGIRWIVKNARLRKEKGFEVRLANEIYDTYRGRGSTIRKKLEMHRIAALNRPFIRYLRKKPKR